MYDHKPGAYRGENKVLNSPGIGVVDDGEPPWGMLRTKSRSSAGEGGAFVDVPQPLTMHF